MTISFIRTENSAWFEKVYHLSMADSQVTTTKGLDVFIVVTAV